MYSQKTPNTLNKEVSNGVYEYIDDSEMSGALFTREVEYKHPMYDAHLRSVSV